MPSLVFRSTKIGLFDRTLNLTTGTFYAHLVTTAPTDPLQTTVSQLTVAAGGNYTAATLNNRTISQTATGVFLTFDNPVWTSLTTNNAATVKGMVVCRQTGGTPAGTDPIVCFNELNSPYTPNGANFTVQISATGVLDAP